MLFKLCPKHLLHTLPERDICRLINFRKIIFILQFSLLLPSFGSLLLSLLGLGSSGRHANSCVLLLPHSLGLENYELVHQKCLESAHRDETIKPDKTSVEVTSLEVKNLLILWSFCKSIPEGKHGQNNTGKSHHNEQKVTQLENFLCNTRLLGIGKNSTSMVNSFHEIMNEQEDNADSGKPHYVSWNNKSQVQTGVLYLGRHIFLLGFLEVQLWKHV